MDLALIVPLAFVGGVLLLQRHAWGYLLAAVLVMKLITISLAVSVQTTTASAAVDVRAQQLDPATAVVTAHLTEGDVLCNH